MTPLQAVRGHDPSAATAAAVQWLSAEVRCAVRELDADHVAAARHAVSEVKRIANNTYAGAVPTTQSLIHSHTLSLLLRLRAQGSWVFAFLVCTKAGGIVINLASADSTIFAYIIYLT
jgi:hypothetical protein